MQPLTRQAASARITAFMLAIRTYLFLLGVLLILSCRPESRGDATIEFWTLQLSPAFDGYVKGVIEAFESRHPGVAVRWMDVPFEGITQKYLSAIASGNAPDVINLPGDYVRKYAKLEALTEVDSLVPDSIWHSYLPASMKSLTVGERIYGVPWYLATKIMIFDRQKIAVAGFNPDSIPRTFDELLRFAESYHRRTGSFAFFYNLVVDSYLYQVLVSEGVPLISSDGRAASFASPEGIRVLQRWAEVFRSGAMPRECLFEGHQGGIATFQSGTVALFVGAPQFLRIIRENAPNIYARTGVAPSVAGRTGKTELDVMCLVLSSQCRNPRLAAEFSTFVTNAENQLRFSHLVPVFPSVRSAFNDPFFRQEDGTLESRARTIGARQIAHSEVLKPSLNEYQRLNNIFKDEMLRAFLGRASVSDALRAAERQWTKILQEDQ